MGLSALIDVTPQELRFYLIKRETKGYSIVEERHIGIKDSYLDALKELEARMDVERVYLSLPLDYFSIRILELPFTDKNRLKDVLPFELEGLLFKDVGEMAFDSIIIGEKDGKNTVLVTAAEKKSLKEMIEALKQKGLEPEIINSIDLRMMQMARGSNGQLELSELLLSPIYDDKDRMKTAIAELDTPSFNIRQGDIAYTTGREKMIKSLRWTMGIGIILLLLIGADLSLRYFHLRNEVSTMNREIRKVYLDAFPKDIKVRDELYQFKVHMKEAKDKENLFHGLSPLDVLLSIANKKTQGLVYNEISMDESKIGLKGEAPSFTDVNRLKSALSDLGDVIIADTKSALDGKINFTINIKVKR